MTDTRDPVEALEVRLQQLAAEAIAIRVELASISVPRQPDPALAGIRNVAAVGPLLTRVRHLVRKGVAPGHSTAALLAALDKEPDVAT